MQLLHVYWLSMLSDAVETCVTKVESKEEALAEVTSMWIQRVDSSIKQIKNPLDGLFEESLMLADIEYRNGNYETALSEVMLIFEGIKMFTPGSNVCICQQENVNGNVHAV